jgi:hypothetical protein
MLWCGRSTLGILISAINTGIQSDILEALKVDVPNWYWMEYEYFLPIFLQLGNIEALELIDPGAKDHYPTLDPLIIVKNSTDRAKTTEFLSQRVELDPEKLLKLACQFRDSILADYLLKKFPKELDPVDHLYYFCGWALQGLKVAKRFKLELSKLERAKLISEPPFWNMGL